MSLIFFTFNYFIAVILEDKLFQNEVLIEKIAVDIAIAEDSIKNALSFNNAFEYDIEAQKSMRKQKN